MRDLEETAELIPGDGVERPRVEDAIREILLSVGEDPAREGLLATPQRVGRMYDELLAGYRVDPVALINDALFDESYDDMVIVRDIEFYSLCEHHLLPFVGRVHVAYIPDGRILGLSKIPRVVEMFAWRLQVQEKMTRQIANFLENALHPQGVGVVVEAAHLCAMMRGVNKANARMTTSTMLGLFRKDPRTRQEFMEHIARGASGIHF